MNRIKVNIILVNYNTVADTIECLESLLKQSYDNFQIFVVDNSTELGTINNFLSWADGFYRADNVSNYPEYVLPLVRKPISYLSLSEDEFKRTTSFKKGEVVFIKAEKNEGFAAANNIVLNHFRDNGDEKAINWLLNNDTVVSKTAIQSIVTFYLSNKKSGIIGTSLMEYSDKNKIQAIGGLYSAITSKLYIPTSWSEFKKSNLLKYPNGASMLVTPDFLKKVGVMSEDYFLYFEELDWVLRGKEAGFTPSFLVEPIVYHKGGASTGKNSELADYYYLRGKILVVLKFFRKYRFIVLPLLFVAFPINRILKGQFYRVKIVIQVLRDLIKQRIS